MRAGDQEINPRVKTVEPVFVIAAHGYLCLKPAGNSGFCDKGELGRTSQAN